MTRIGRTTIDLKLGSLDESDLTVRRVAGREALSEPFQFDIQFRLVSGEPLDMSSVCGEKALVTLTRPDGAQRLVNGIVQSLRVLEVLDAVPHYEVRIVPALELLRYQKRSRAFLNIGLSKLTLQLLGDASIAFRSDLKKSYPNREYVVQYQESDFDFLSRLLEEAGITYAFEHQSDSHLLVLSDSPPDASSWPQIPYRAEQTLSASVEVEAVTRLGVSRELAVDRLAIGDYDFSRPALALGSATGAGKAKGPLEHYEFPARFDDPGAAADLAKTRLQEAQVRTAVFAAESTCLAFCPGSGFELTEHPLDENNGKQLLLRVRHLLEQVEGSEGEALEHSYQNWIEALAEGTAYRPPRRTPRPKARPTTATVVGSEEIATDSLGRVQVNFHWHGEGQDNPPSSCWLRCAQTLAGSGWGALFIPRVGQEVVVQFLEGDPDRPIVTGAVYNGANTPPLTLPDHKTESTLLTSSSPGNSGANELRFEDQAGSEYIFLHAQKDENRAVLHDKTQKIGANEARQVVKDRSASIKKNETLSVSGDSADSIGGRQSATIGKAFTGQVAGSRLQSVAKKGALSIGGSRTLTVQDSVFETHGAAAALGVGGALVANVAADVSHSVGGNTTTTIGAMQSEHVSGDKSEEVRKGNTAKVGSTFASELKGEVSFEIAKDQTDNIEGKLQMQGKDAGQWQAKAIEIQADSMTLIVNGQVALHIDNSGNVTFGAAGFTINADSKIALKGSKVTMDSGGSPSSGSSSVPQL